MKSLVRSLIATAFFGISLSVQANPTTFNDLAQEDLYQVVSPYSTTKQGAGPSGARSSQLSSARSDPSWSTGRAVNETLAGSESQGSAPMPESQTNALMLAGLGVMAMMAMRRRRGD